MNFRVVLLNRFAFHRGEFCAVDEQLLDKPPLAGDGGILLNRQHHHERVGNHKQDHQERQQGRSRFSLGDGWVQQCFLGKQMAPRFWAP